MSRMTRAAAAAALIATAGAVVPAGAVAANQSDVVLELAHSKGLRAFVRAVSDPESPRYRQYATIGQLSKRFGASPRTKAKARAFADAHGLEAEMLPTGQHMVVRTDAATARDVFGGASARSAGGRFTPAVPAALDGAVTAVAVLPAGPALQTAAAPRAAGDPVPGAGSAREHSGTSAGCTDAVNLADGPIKAFTPNQWLDAYGLSTLHERGLTGKGQRIALVEIDGVHLPDIDAFAACFGGKAPKIAVHPVTQKQRLAPGMETTLDLQVLSVAAPGVERIDVYEGNGSPPGILQTVAAALGKKGDHPTVISISLDGCEPFYTDAVIYARAVDGMFAMAAGAGISTFVATGDQGSTPCNGHNKVPVPVEAATFPSTSPHVTAVGGTNLVLDARNRIVDQIVWNDAPRTWAATSGGESLIFARPWYQTATLPRTFANDTHRYTPDIAALADEAPGYGILCSSCGGWTIVGGTSAATPLMAGAIALVNQAAAERKQAPVGLINPLVYELASSKRADRYVWDVTEGSNDVGALAQPPVGTGEPFGCCSAGKGYDQVTGWGSLKVPAFSAAALQAGRAR